MVAKDTSYGTETYRPYLDIERIINVQSAGSVNWGHDPIPLILIFNQDQIPDYMYIWNPTYMLPPATVRSGAFCRYHAAAQVFLNFDVYLKKLVDHKDVKFYFTMIGYIWGWFEEIRSVLQVSREFSGKEQNNLPTNADKLKGKTIEAMMKIRGEGRGERLEAI